MNPKYDSLPEHMQKHARDYVEKGIPPGDFLRAVLEDSLSKSFGRADLSNRDAMWAWASWLWNDIPTSAWGSRERVDKWVAHHGLNGFAEREEMMSPVVPTTQDRAQRIVQVVKHLNDPLKAVEAIEKEMRAAEKAAVRQATEALIGVAEWAMEHGANRANVQAILAEARRLGR